MIRIATYLAPLLFASAALAQHHGPHQESHEMATGPAGCGDMEVWDFSLGMCEPRAMAGMPMRMLMLHGNAFFAQTVEEGPRGRSAFTVPNMVMLDAGTSVGDRHYVNLDVMATFEKWTFPKNGYPLLLQIGEENEDHARYLDAQHPHSSPLMGLTLSDTISLGEDKDYAKVWFAPRGQATDGPVAFMHRATGHLNPDAPLGHHIGQDVGHITSTVLGASLKINKTSLEASTFNGTEPEPSKVDLPLGTMNSYATRLTYELTPKIYAMTSAAFVKSPEPHDPQLDHIWRYSASVYSEHELGSAWQLNNTLIWGLVNDYDHSASLNSFAEEFWFRKAAQNIWGRVEVLQRTPAELAITGAADPDRGRWTTAATLGYTHELASIDVINFSLGGSVTKDFLPADFTAAYGGDPLSAKIFLQVQGMKMLDL